MTSKKVQKDPSELIFNAHSNGTFIYLEGHVDGSISKKPNLSIGGAQSHYDNGKYFFYWPKYRLAGLDYATLIRYVLLNREHIAEFTDFTKSKDKITFGPFIGGEDNKSGGASPQPFMVSCSVASVSKRKLNDVEPSSFLSDMPIPNYRYKLEKKVLSVRESTKEGKGKSPAKFIEEERVRHSEFAKNKKENASKEGDLDNLAKQIYKYKIPSKSGKSGKTSGESKEVTLEFFEGQGFNDRVAKNVEKGNLKGKKYKKNDYWLNISKLTQNLGDSRVVRLDKLNENFIRFGDSRIVFTKESAKSLHSGPIWYFRLKNGWNNEEEDDSDGNKAASKSASKELKSVLNEGVTLDLSNKKKGKAGDSSEEESKKKKDKKKKDKKKKEEEEEEEEEE